MIIQRDKAQELIHFNHDFDFEMIDQDFGFQTKIFTLIPQDVFEDLEHTHTEIYELIAKAGLHYSFVLDIPKIKVHILNYGINQFDEGKSKTAPWWDIRDLGLSWLKKADECLAQALALLGKEKVSGVKFFEESFGLVSFEEMQKFYKIGNSPFVYLELSRMMESLLQEMMQGFGACDASVFLGNTRLALLIKNYLLNKVIEDSTMQSSLVFLTNGIAIQYEELPWQKSVVLSPQMLGNIQKKYRLASEYWLKEIWRYLNEHSADFPCLGNNSTHSKEIIVKKSGIYL